MPKSPTKTAHAFTLVECLAIAALVAILAALLLPVLSKGQVTTDRAKMLSAMKSVGVAMNLYAADHGGQFVGPLWPGQVALYDRNRRGRLVRELAPYLEIEDRSSPYVVNAFLTGTLRRSLPRVAPGDIRVWVMNMAIPKAGETINPWGNEAATPKTQPLPAAALADIPPNTWAMSEAYQGHPAVVSAPWRLNTATLPSTGRRPLALFFDGRVAPHEL